MRNINWLMPLDHVHHISLRAHNTQKVISSANEQKNIKARQLYLNPSAKTLLDEIELLNIWQKSCLNRSYMEMSRRYMEISILISTPGMWGEVKWVWLGRNAQSEIVVLCVNTIKLKPRGTVLFLEWLFWETAPTDSLCAEGKRVAAGNKLANSYFMCRG